MPRVLLMPTTCGFPACKFRSRYQQGSPVPDNRHFYRVPKKPAELRQRWLTAIGRTEETIVSQVRLHVCPQSPLPHAILSISPTAALVSCAAIAAR